MKSVKFKPKSKYETKLYYYQQNIKQLTNKIYSNGLNDV
jgi:hypothetical protein